MTKKAPNFQIVPIFNQNAQGIWRGFLDVEIACDSKIYKLDPPCAAVMKNRLRGYKSNLDDYKHNFAFAAFSGKRIIGFAHGYAIDTHEAYLHHLYVLPQYHKCGIGTKLLQATEQACSMFATKLSLIALVEAVPFYEQKQGYDGPGRNKEKELRPCPNAVVPVFQWIKKDLSTELRIPVDTLSLKQSKYQPIFAHTNEYCQIDAMATRTNGGKNKIWMPVNTPQPELDLCAHELLNALGKAR